MPRARKALPAQTEAGQAYGVAGEQQAAMKQMPIQADTSQQALATGSPVAAQPPVSAPAQTPGPTGGPPPDPMAAALGSAQQMQPPQGSVFDPTQRPHEPVTAGLASGPGPGPEALSMTAPTTRPTPVADLIARLAANAGGNSALAQMAAEARTRGQ